jgi:hypothetical protein
MATGELVGWLVGWLVGRLVGWLVGWLVYKVQVVFEKRSGKVGGDVCVYGGDSPNIKSLADNTVNAQIV